MSSLVRRIVRAAKRKKYTHPLGRGSTFGVKRMYRVKKQLPRGHRRGVRNKAYLDRRQNNTDLARCAR